MSKSIMFTCPCIQKSSLIEMGHGLVCADSTCPHSEKQYCFPVIGGWPVLISELRCDTVCSAQNINSYVARGSVKFAGLKKLISGDSQVTKRNCSRFVEELHKNTSLSKVLVIGSGEKGLGTDALWNCSGVEIHGIDIYASDSTDAVCDAHYLPFADQSYDGVWIQAVLEHVVEPNVVVGEIYRVLKEGGVVYAETPFMQQVHEGAYDFTRFTVVGHRFLFRKFEAIDFGGMMGAETVLAWAIRYFVWALTRSRKVARVFGVCFNFLLRPFSGLMSKASLFDASSGVFFMGRKKSGHEVSHKELVSLYKGQFN